MTTRKKKPRAQSSVLVGPDTEWTDYRGIQMLFGIRRSLLYHLDKQGLVKSRSISVSNKKRKSARGKRLFYVPSVRRFLNPEIEAAA
jgi:hypothetical protein